jgi:hypothetical protein
MHLAAVLPSVFYRRGFAVFAAARRNLLSALSEG